MTRCRWRLCRAHAGRLEARRRHVSVPSERSGRARFTYGDGLLRG